MIVKNEAHVIRQTLENISKYIDYYVNNQIIIRINSN